MLEIALFGEPRFLIEGRPHAFVAPPKTLPLLAYLLLHRNTPVAREELAGIFWPDADEDTARANLRRHLHYVRKSLPPGEWLHVDGKTVQWNAEAAYRLDVAEFEQQSKLPQMRSFAAKLYRGDLYRTCEEEWLYFERERLHSMQIGNLAALAQDAERALDHVAAAAYARELLEMEPWREDAVRVLMRARMQQGDRGGALVEYERFCTRLADEMGVEPMDETRELYEAFARKEAHSPAVPMRGRDIIGRNGEVEALLVHWRGALSERGAFVLVGGEAGVGKSALLRELAQHARDGGAIVLTGEVPSQGDEPFGAVTRALAQAEASGKLRTSRLPSFAPGLTDTVERGAFFASVAATLRSIAEQSPVLLCLEDLHWAGGDTIALIEFLERRLRDVRILVAGSYREDAIAADHPLRALRRVVAARAASAHVALNPLTIADAERIVRKRLGERANGQVVQTLYRRSQGNAFFLTELLENVTAGHEHEVPESIRDLVDERRERLSSAARDLILQLAVAATAIAPDLLSALAGGDEKAFGRALDELVQARFLYEETGPAGISYAFRHDVVRESLYEGISAERRAALHARIAEAMERVSATRYAAAIAYHHEHAGNAHAAAQAYERAAAQAIATFANEDAERYARKALSLHDDADVAVKAYGHLHNVYHRTGNRELQSRAAQDMEAAAERSGNPDHICQAIYHRLAQAFYENDADALKTGLERLQVHMPRDPVWQARFEMFCGKLQQLSGNPDGAWEGYHRALSLCREADHTYGQLVCYVLLLDMCDGHTRPFDILLQEARALERQLGDPDSAFLLANAEARLFLHVDRTQCRHSALRIIDAGERTGDQVYFGLGHMYLGAVATYRFEPEAAEEHLSAAYTALVDTAWRADIARLMRFRGLYHFSIGDVERGIEDSLASLARAREAHAPDLMGSAAGNALYGYALSGRYQDGERLAAQVLAELDGVRQHYFALHHMMLSLGMVLGARNAFSEAIPLMKQAYEEHVIREHKLHAAWAGTSLAYQLLRAGRAPEARQYVEAYLKILPEMLDEGWNPQETLWQAAQVLRALDRREQAQALLERAAQVVASRLAVLSREEQQRRFLESPVNREILRARGEGIWPKF